MAGVSSCGRLFISYARKNKVCDKLAGLSGDFAALHQFKKPDWHPASQPGSSRFVGRLQELWRTHTTLNPVGISDHENHRVIVRLTGLGGIGKSLLAIEYAKRALGQPITGASIGYAPMASIPRSR